MSIGAVGNVIFVNQQATSVASVQGNQNTRFDLQNVAAQTLVNEKEKEVLEVRPTEENSEVDPDREHDKQEADEELSEQKKMKKHNDTDENEDEIPLHRLDIKV
jgi:hypothetical protein